MTERKLTLNQKRFIEELLADPHRNATNAYRKAYPNCKGDAAAAAAAARLLKDVKIQQAVAEADAARAKRVEVDQDYVVLNLTEVVERCMQRAPVMTRQGGEVVQATDDDGRNVWRFDARGAVSALHLLGQHLSMFKSVMDLNLKGPPFKLYANFDPREVLCSPQTPSLPPPMNGRLNGSHSPPSVPPVN